MHGHGRDTNSGLKPFYTDILLHVKNGGTRTSEYLNVHSNISSKQLVRIWQRRILSLFFAMTHRYQ